METERAVLSRLLSTGIKPNAEAIASIISQGEVAVIMFETHPYVQDELRAGGHWDGSPVWRMPVDTCKAIARAMIEDGDIEGGHFLAAEKRKGRVLVYLYSGMFLLNLPVKCEDATELGNLTADEFPATKVSSLLVKPDDITEH